MAVVHGTNNDFKVPSLDLRFADRKNFIDTISGEDLITFTRNSIGTYVDSNGVIQSAASGVARFDHDPVTGESLGLLIEEARTNLLPYSDDFSTWSTNNLSVTANSTSAPDGNLTADKLVESATSGYHTIVKYGISFTASTSYTLSVLAKASERSRIGFGGSGAMDAQLGSAQGVVFDLTGNGSVVVGGSGAAITKISNNWYKCSYTWSQLNTGSYYVAFGPVITNTTNYTGDGASGIYIWGAQLETGSFPTSYIPTPATFTSRASTATYYDANGVIQTAGVNVARDNAYLPDENGVFKPAGLLLEGAVTNFLYPSTPNYTGGFGSWSNGLAPTVPNAGIAPDGTNTAVRVDWSTVSGAERLYYDTGTPTTVGITEVHSFFVKPVGTGVVFNVYFWGVNWSWLNGSTNTKGFSFDFDSETFSATSGANYGEVITKLPNGWYRISIPAINNGTGVFDTYVAIQRNVQVGDWYIWGVQRENGSLPTSYIPTTGSTATRAADVSTSSTVTRAADVASITGSNFSSWYNHDQGTFTLKTSALKSTAGTGSILLGGISGAGYGENEIFNNVNNEVWFINYLNSPFRKITHNVSAGDNRIAVAYDNQTAESITVNGTVSTTSQSFTANANVITGISLMRRNPQDLVSNGHISRFTYYPTRLSNALLQKLTK